jgi:ElaA protein
VSPDLIDGDLREAPLRALTPETLYGILALRSAVFVVEQECAYLDLDGRDLEDGAVQLWIERDGAVAATLRLLWDEPAVARIGRVATAADARSAGLAGRLMQRALELAGAGGAGSVVLDAQARLEQWYGGLGFVRSGADYLEDGILHLPMTLHLPESLHLPDTRTYPGSHDR